MILAGDIGGTKTNVALFDTKDGRIGQPIALQSFPSARHTSLNAIVEEYLSHNKADIERACFGIAGPVVGNRVEATNLPWIVDGGALSKTIGGAPVRLINDLEANAFGIETLKDEQLFTLNEGDPNASGHRALIAAGTGLGMAGLYFDGTRYRPLASEGGHADFAPRNETEIELFKFMERRLGGEGAHVSYERVLSGMGLHNVYLFMRETGKAEEPAWLAEEMAAGDKSAAISKAALAGRAEIAVRALHLMVEIYGAAAGNLALTFKSTGGLYIGGGVAPKILDKLKDGSFMRTFKDKGRMSGLVSKIPVRVILEDKTALYGAAQCALSEGAS